MISRRRSIPSNGLMSCVFGSKFYSFPVYSATTFIFPRLFTAFFDVLMSFITAKSF